MQEPGDNQPGNDHFFTSKLKLPWVLWVSSPTACQLTVYLPGARSPFTGTINCALPFLSNAVAPTGCAFPAESLSSIPVKASSTGSLNCMRIAFGEVVTTLPGAGPAAFSTACASALDVTATAAAAINMASVGC